MLRAQLVYYIAYSYWLLHADAQVGLLVCLFVFLKVCKTAM